MSTENIVNELAELLGHRGIVAKELNKIAEDLDVTAAKLWNMSSCGRVWPKYLLPVHELCKKLGLNYTLADIRERRWCAAPSRYRNQAQAQTQQGNAA